MEYKEMQAGEGLGEAIECFWTLRGKNEGEAGEPVRILPDGCMELILNFGDSFRQRRGDGRTEKQPREFVVGQMAAPVVIQPGKNVDVLGVRFRPGGTAGFVEPPAEKLTGRMERLEDVAKGLHKELKAELGSARTTEERVARVRPIFWRLAMRGGGRRQSARAARVIERTMGQVSVSGLAREMGISPRHLERRFEAEVGIGPKLLCRILRFQRVFRAVEELPEANWAAIAQECGYADQSHLNRDFRQFAGMTPPDLLSKFDDLTEIFTRKRRA